jgi:glycosyltransferase involved in cell wall biosynthesis
MRLTLVNQFYTPDLSPTAHLCASLAEHRAAKGDDVTVVTGRGGYVRSVPPDEDQSVRVVRLWTPQLGSTSRLRRLIDWLSFYVPAFFHLATMPPQDVVICLTTPPLIALSGVVHKLLHPHTKLALWNMDCYPEAIERTGMVKPHGVIAQIIRAFNRLIFARIDALICLDSAMRDLLLPQYAPQGRQLPCEIIPNWERMSFFPVDRPVPTWANPVVQQLKDRFVVLYLGNAGYGHEFATALAAAEELKNDLVVFLFVGGGAMQPWIRQEAQRRGLSNIILCDYVDKEQTPSVMSIADYALITLENYAAGVMSPSKLHSNLAMGLPVIYLGPKATNVDEAINRFACGISVRPGDPGRVAQFIRSVAADPAKKQILQSQARRAFEAAYCDRSTLPQFDILLDRLASLR